MEEIARKGRKGKMDMQSEIAKRLAVACRGYIPYTEYRGPVLRGFREGPLYGKKYFLERYKKKVERKKKIKKSMTRNKKKCSYIKELWRGALYESVSGVLILF